MKKSNVIWVDCDGVLADFINPFLEMANSLTGLQKTPQDIVGWDMLPLYPEDKHETILNHLVQPGWCLQLKPYPGAYEGLRELRNLGPVKCATAPWTSKTWCWEREEWLKKHMGFSRHEINHIHDKWDLRGVTLIDDKIETLVKWGEETGRTGILWTQPYNRNFDCFGYGIWRANSWDDVISYVKAILHEQPPV